MDASKLKAYYYLTKPGIIYANVLTAIAGYLYGSEWDVHLSSLFGVVVGTALVIAAACVYNNVMDRNLDKQMKRTKKRALVTGKISIRAAFAYATILFMTGMTLLLVLTNLTVVTIGLIGYIDYVFLYGWAKRHTSWSTIIGSVSGSTSIIAGYCAATNTFNADAALLFLILTLWQMPHFYAIAMFRAKDYSTIHLPLMPLLKGESTAKLRILLYILAFGVTTVLFTMLGAAGITSLVILLVLSAAWFATGVKNYQLPAAVWGKQMFLFSLIVNLVISLAVAIGSITP